jgi:hypothetical protein
MKHDCPNCNQALRRTGPADFDRSSGGFACSNCGAKVRAQIHNIEWAGILLIILSAYFAAQVFVLGKGATATIVYSTAACVILEAVIILVAIRYMSRDKQRYVLKNAV